MVSVFALTLSGPLEAVCRQSEEVSRLAESIAGRYAARVIDETLAFSSRVEALAAGLLVRSVLHVGRDEQIVVSREGKPGLADGSASMSISHGGSYCMLAVSPTMLGPIGLDIEPVAEYNRAAARRVLAGREIEWIEETADESVRAERFCMAWTALEALLKAEGTGFERDPRAEGLPSGWRVGQRLWKRHVVSVAAREPIAMRISELDPTELMAAVRRRQSSV